MKLFITVLSAALTIVNSVQGADYYVAMDGNDNNSGLKGKPFATIQKAADIMKPGDTCFIRKGEYLETVIPANSGNRNNPITFRAFENETVTVSGTTPVTGWKKHNGSIYKASMDWDLGKNNQVFFDGEMLDEARWPDNTDGNLMTPDATEISSADSMGLSCLEFPDSFSKTDWDGSIIWVMANKKWTSWSATIKGYEPAGEKLLFEVPNISSGAMDPSRGGEFYIVGKMALLDYPGEWYYESETATLYLWAPGNVNPNEYQITAKKRLLAFDLRNQAYIHIQSVNIRGATIDMEGARHCLVQGIKAMYISHTHGGRTSYGLGEKTGIYMSGNNNTIRDSEIVFSVGDGVMLAGKYNAVINCWIHNMDYFGCCGTPVKASGIGHLISHNTIHDTGRDCIQLRGQEHLIQYNDVFHPGMMAHDLGALYTDGNDGGGTEIHHNWFHDNLSDGLQLGLYLDNFTSNYLCHHNVVWGVKRDELRFNKPSEYNMMINNTAFGDFGQWGRWPEDGMFGDLILNNLLTGTFQEHPEPILLHNEFEVSEDIITPENFQSADNRPGIDAGMVVAGITDEFKDEAPDLGAYEKGGDIWKPGHDFNNPPNPTYRLTETPLRNRVKNACFELSRNAQLSQEEELGPWQKTHAKNARIIRGRGGIETNPKTRNSIMNNSVRLSGTNDDGIEQVITGLDSNTRYTLAGWFKVDDVGEIRIGVRDYGGKDVYMAVNDTLWQHPIIEFTTGENITSAKIYLLKAGNGTAYADDIGLVPAFEFLVRRR